MKSSRRSNTVRRSSVARRLYAASLVAAFVSGRVAAPAVGEVYRWVGNPADGPTNQLHAWRYQQLIGTQAYFINWRQGNDPATSTPGAIDTAQFDGFEGKPCYLNGPRTVGTVVFNTSGAISGERINIVTGRLTIDSGNLSVNNSSNAFLNNGPFENAVSGTWFVGTGSSIRLRTNGFLDGHGFTKTGAGLVQFEGPQVFTSPISIDEGIVGFEAYTSAELPAGVPLISNSMYVGNSSGTVGDARLEIGNMSGEVVGARPNELLINPGAEIAIRGDGEMELSEVRDLADAMSFGRLSLEGGRVTFNSMNAPLLRPAEFNARPGLVGGQFQAASITGQNGGKWILPASGQIVNVLSTTINGLGASETLDISPAIEGGVLRLHGSGTTTIQGGAANTHTGTSIRSGTLLLDKTPGSNAVGGYLDVGLADTASSGLTAAVRLKRSDQMPDGNTMKIWQGGTFGLDAGVSERIGEVTFAGGNMSSASTSTLTFASTLTKVVSGNSVASVGVIDLNNTLHEIEFQPGTSLTINGRLDRGSLAVRTPGTLTLGGTSPNSIGSVTAHQGTLVLSKSHGVAAVSGGFQLGQLNQTANRPTVRFMDDNQIAADTNVTLAAGVVDLNGHLWIVNNLTAEGSGLIGINSGAGGVLRVASGFVAQPGALVTLLGDLSVNSPSTTFDARGDGSGQSGFTNFKIVSSNITDGTLNKNGVGRIEFDAIGGNAIVNVNAGNIDVNAVTFGGLSGGGSVTLSGNLTLNTGSTTTAIYGAAIGSSINGTGNFTKSGPGTQILGTFFNNTINGLMNVNSGTLQLSTLIVRGAVPGTLNIGSSGIVSATLSNQFAASSIVNNSGELRLASTTQNFARLNLNGGRLTGGALNTSGGVFLNSGEISDATLNISGGGLHTDGLNDRVTRVIANVPLDLNSNLATINDSTFRGLRGGGFGSLTTGGNITVQVDSGIITYNGLLVGDGGLIKRGAGEQRFFGLNANYSGMTTLEAGKLTLRRNALTDNWTGILNISDGVDIKRGTLSFLYEGGVTSPRDTIVPQLAAAYASNFTSGRFRSSTTVADQTTLGWSDGAEPDQFMIVFTRVGDANLDGRTDLIDFGLMAANFNTAGGWPKGDFDYSGTVNVRDFALLAANFNQSPLSNLPRAGAVPEPTAALILLAALSAVRTRFRIASSATTRGTSAIRLAATTVNPGARHV